MWKLWSRTLGDKTSDDTREADISAMIRTFWVILHVITCISIIANAIHQW